MTLKLLAEVWPPCYSILSACFLHCLAHAPAIHAASHVEHEKTVSWFSVSMHASHCCFSYDDLIGNPELPLKIL